MAAADSFIEQNDFPDIVPEVLVFEAESALPNAFLKMLLVRLLSDSKLRALSVEEMANRYADSVSKFSCGFIQIRMSDKALSEAGVSQELLSEDAENLRDRIFSFYLTEIRDEYLCYPVIIAGIRTIIFESNFLTIPHSLHERNQIKELEIFLSAIQQKMLNNFGFTTHLIISSIHSLENMPSIFQQTLFMMDYIIQLYPGRNITSFLPTVENPPDLSALHPRPEFERLYFDSIADYDFNMANKLLQKLIYNDTLNPATALSVRTRLHSKMSWTLNYLNIPRIQGIAECMALHECADYVAVCKTIDKAKECVDDFFIKLSVYYRKFSLNASEKSDMISGYIKENFMDPTLSVGKICEFFNISPSHLSRIFKEKTGLKTIDYIHLTRLSEAKILIKTTSLTLDEIAIKVGYAGYWTLIRAFRRYENTTPGSLRSTYKDR